MFTSLLLKALTSIYLVSIFNNRRLMKKILFSLIIIITAQWCYAQSSDNIFREFKNENKAEYVTVSPFIMSLAKVCNGNDADNDFINNIKSVKVLDLEECSASVKQRFSNKVNKLKLSGYETMIRVNDNGEKVRILTKKHKDKISELLIICVGDDDCALIKIKGDIDSKDLTQIVNEQTTKKNGCHKL